MGVARMAAQATEQTVELSEASEPPQRRDVEWDDFVGTSQTGVVRKFVTNDQRQRSGFGFIDVRVPPGEIFPRNPSLFFHPSYVTSGRPSWPPVREGDMVKFIVKRGRGNKNSHTAVDIVNLSMDCERKPQSNPLPPSEDKPNEGLLSNFSEVRLSRSPVEKPKGRESREEGQGVPDVQVPLVRALSPVHLQPVPLP